MSGAASMFGARAVLCASMSDAALAARVLEGDGQAVAELAHRYRGLIGFTTRNPAEGQDRDDERQEALLALLEACSIYDPARGSFGAIATVRVRSRVWNSRRRACAPGRGQDHPSGRRGGRRVRRHGVVMASQLPRRMIHRTPDTLMPNWALQFSIGYSSSHGCRASVRSDHGQP
jgi:hypothetical protein